MGKIDVHLVLAFRKINFSFKNQNHLRRRNCALIEACLVGLNHPYFYFTLWEIIGKTCIIRQPCDDTTGVEFVGVIQTFAQTAASPVAEINRVKAVIWRLWR